MAARSACTGLATRCSVLNSPEVTRTPEQGFAGIMCARTAAFNTVENVAKIVATVESA
ncbi:hypothetical protein [Actinophytocola sp.]|uniref:hypothetical protein n=1 Tax=Actinophytocola sp. TaxID=1872138 RepID=UPI00345B95A2